MIDAGMRIAAAVAALAGLLTIFSLLGAWLPAADSVAHFRFHLAAITATATIPLALGRRWRFAGLAGLITIVGVAGMGPALPSWGSAKASVDPRSITLVQLNLLYLNSKPQAVADFIREQNADIVTFQEVSKRSSQALDLLAADYPYTVRCPFGSVGGVAVLSRLPTVPGVSHGCVEGKGLTWIRVLAGAKPVSVASLHLHWPWPFRQPRQIQKLEDHLAAIPQPVLLAGDFNAAPWSHAASRVATATDTRVAPGLRFTYDIRINRWIPPVPVPIDHILTSRQIETVDLRLGRGPGSDHRSIVARLNLSPDRNTGPQDN